VDKNHNVETGRECPACGSQNAPGADRCLTCGQSLSILDPLFSRVTGTEADWLREAREEAPVVKMQEQAASEVRLAEMREAEAHYREALAQAQAERERRERITTIFTIGLVALVIIATLVTLALVTRGLPGP